MSMDVEKFLKEYNRMCTGRACKDCEVGRAKLQANMSTEVVSCMDMLKMFPAVVVEIVERWSQDNPVRTRQSAFLKQWPNASRDTSGVLSITPCVLDSSKSKKCSAYPNCSECRRAFWSEEVQ